MMYELNVHLNLENSNVVHFCKNLSSKVRSSYISSGLCIQLRMCKFGLRKSGQAKARSPQLLAMDMTFHFMLRLVINNSIKQIEHLLS